MKTIQIIVKILGGLAVSLGINIAAHAGTQGVSDAEIVLGSHQPLSGPLAGWGVPTTNGMRMRVEEIYSAGGINGRKIKVIVEDTAYSPTKAAQAGSKLIDKDKIFAMVAALGTPTNMVTIPMLQKRGLHNLFPMSAARSMYEPIDPLKFSMFASYYQGSRSTIKYFVEQKDKKSIGILYQDDDFGKDILAGVVDQLEALGMKLTAETTYKRGAKDFSSQIAKLQAANVDLVFLGTVIRETIGAVVTARKMGWNVDMVVNGAGYTPHVAFLAKGATHGLYANFQVPIPYPDTASPELKAWMGTYKGKYDSDANIQAAYGYRAMSLFALAAEKAGRDLNSASLTAAIESISGYTDMFGGPALGFSSTRHNATDQGGLAQIDGTRWVTLIDILE